MYRNRKTRNKYKNIPKTTGCPFCEDLYKKKIIESLEGAYVIKNDFSYHLWDHKKVIDHLLLVPKRHVQELDDLTLPEQQDIFNLMVKYEKSGYDVFMRGTGSTLKTVPAHQHTHLLKTSGKHISSLLYLKKPYLVINT